MADKLLRIPRSLIRQYGTNNPFYIAEALGIHVHLRSMKRQKAFCLYVLRNYFIEINDNLSEQMKRMACAHELAHIILHRHLLKPGRGEKMKRLVEMELFDITNITEYEANLFAANLLIDDNDLMEYLHQGYDIVQTASSLNVNVNLLAIKLSEIQKSGLQINVPLTPSRRFLGKIEDRADSV